MFILQLPTMDSSSTVSTETSCEHSKVPSAFPFDIGYQVFGFNTAITQADAEELEINTRGQSSMNNGGMNICAA